VEVDDAGEEEEEGEVGVEVDGVVANLPRFTVKDPSTSEERVSASYRVTFTNTERGNSSTSKNTHSSFHTCW